MAERAGFEPAVLFPVHSISELVLIRKKPCLCQPVRKKKGESLFRAVLSIFVSLEKMMNSSK
jgi:hypothetical protein